MSAAAPTPCRPVVEHRPGRPAIGRAKCPSVVGAGVQIRRRGGIHGDGRHVQIEEPLVARHPRRAAVLALVDAVVDRADVDRRPVRGIDGHRLRPLSRGRAPEGLPARAPIRALADPARETDRIDRRRRGPVEGDLVDGLGRRPRDRRPARGAVRGAVDPGVRAREDEPRGAGGGRNRADVQIREARVRGRPRGYARGRALENASVLGARIENAVGGRVRGDRLDDGSRGPELVQTAAAADASPGPTSAGEHDENSGHGRSITRSLGAARRGRSVLRLIGKPVAIAANCWRIIGTRFAGPSPRKPVPEKT